MSEAAVWRRCSACKKPIGLGAVYWACNVSTCNRKRTAFAFCSVECWEVHLPEARHRESWAVERRAPKVPEADAGERAASGNATRTSANAGGPSPDGSVASGRAARTSADGSAASADVAGPSGGGRRRLVRPAASAGGRRDDAPREILIVASRLKDYVRARSGMNTSDRALGPLSDLVRRAVDEAIRNASREGRKTVLDRDVPKS